MENIKTAAPHPFAENRTPEDMGYIVTPQLPLVSAYDEEFLTSYVVVTQDEFGTCVWPADHNGDTIGVVAYVGSHGTTRAAALEALGYKVLDASVWGAKKPKRTPSRTHLNISPDGKRAACGQLNGTHTDIAQTFYTPNTANVTCQKCITTKAFARYVELEDSFGKSLPEERVEPLPEAWLKDWGLRNADGPASRHDAVDRKAWFDTLEDRKDLLQRLNAPSTCPRRYP